MWSRVLIGVGGVVVGGVFGLGIGFIIGRSFGQAEAELGVDGMYGSEVDQERVKQRTVEKEWGVREVRAS